MMISFLCALLLAAWGGRLFYKQVHRLNLLPEHAPHPERLAHAGVLALALGTVLYAISDRPLDAFCIQIAAVILQRILPHATPDRATTGRDTGPL